MRCWAILFWKTIFDVAQRLSKPPLLVVESSPSTRTQKVLETVFHSRRGIDHAYSLKEYISDATKRVQVAEE